jgi:ribosomal peptide maturation radical SAM protein 1
MRVSHPYTVLVGMPWESTSRPSLAIGTLTALARREGFHCTARHLNLTLAAMVGADVYNAFAENVELFPLGEHFFAVDLFGAEALASEDLLAKYGGTEPLGTASPDPLHLLRDRTVPAFLDRVTAELTALAPDVVGFSCTFNQTLPSLALARRLKATLPGVTILLGGACVHGPMGVAYAERFADVVDHVFTGEADDSFPAWLRAVADGDPGRPLPGVTGAADDGGRRTVRTATPTRDLDQLPVPEFREYFAQRSALEQDGATFSHLRHLPYESSRGCWSGQKHHCTFCGLNNEGMAFRRKSPERIVAELEQLSAEHGMTSFMAADNILDFRAYRDLLQQLETSAIDLDLFYEIKANVRRDDVAGLRRAGIRRVQPGIESFSDHVLKVMRKGTTGLRNVEVLRLLQEHGVRADYNVLVGFPGETAEDYAELARVVAAIPHLPPPNGSTITVRVDRFSPFFDEPDALGISGLRAAQYYRHLIPPDRGPAEDLAYFFDRDEPGRQAFAEQVARVDALMADWKRGTIERRARLGRTFVELLTAVDGRRSRRILRDVEALVFVQADAHTTTSDLAAQLGTDRRAVDAAIAELAAADVLLTAGERVVSTIAYAEPHTQAELDAWVARNASGDGAPAAVASSAPAHAVTGA